MKQKTLFVLWGGMFILCAGLGFIPEPEGALRWLLTALSLGFFVPPALLVYRARRDQDKATLTLIRNLSVLWLALTLVLLVLNILSVLWSDFLGNVLHGLMVIVSSPMVCSGSFALCIFLWAALLIVCMKKKK